MSKEHADAFECCYQMGLAYGRTEHEPIVRCRDCKHRETRGLRNYCAAHAGGYPEVSHDDFCSFGERRDA